MRWYKKILLVLLFTCVIWWIHWPFAQAVTDADSPQTVHQPSLLPVIDQNQEEEVNEIWRLFSQDEERQFPFVKTLTYTRWVDWLADREAWVVDYAAHYRTSRHFIARGLHQERDYFNQAISDGDRFNIFDPTYSLSFLLRVNLARCKMWFYVIDLESDHRWLVKTYSVGVGRYQSNGSSLTPAGSFMLGDRVAIYPPRYWEVVQGQVVEMISLFGSRWLPLVDAETGHGCGYGLHGAPWSLIDEEKGEYREERELLGTHSSEGCIRLSKEEIEDLYAIVISRPTRVEIVSE